MVLHTPLRLSLLGVVLHSGTGEDAEGSEGEADLEDMVGLEGVGGPEDEAEVREGSVVDMAVDMAVLVAQVDLADMEALLRLALEIPHQ